MRRLTTTLAIGVVMLSWSSPAAATTSGAICKVACAPRIAEQCTGLTGSAARKCPRLLVKACKKTAPEIGCPTTAELTAALADRVVEIADAASTDVTLCASRRFSLVERLVNGDTRTRDGAWAVRVVGSGLALVLADDTAQAPLGIELDAAGGLLVSGVPAEVGDASGACGAGLVGPSVGDDELLVAVSRVLADRNLIVTVPAVSQHNLTLCSSGVSIRRSLTGVPIGILSSGRGRWTLDTRNGTARLRLDEGGASETIFHVAVRGDGAVLLNGTVAEQDDARGTCAELDLEQRLTEALSGRAFFFVLPGSIPVRVKMGLCETGRYRLETTSSENGDWLVDASAGGAVLRLVKDDSMQLREFPVGFDAQGGVRVQGNAPIDDPGLAEAACAG